MTRKEALVVLESTPAASNPVHQGRADRNPRVGAGASGSQTSHQATVSRWDAAFAKVAPQKRH